MEKWIKELDGMEELVYVADPEKYQLLYMNTCGMQAFGIQKISDTKGIKCYEVLQGRSEPCEFCNNQLLRDDEYVEWEHTNDVINRHFFLKDKLIDWDGRKVRLEIAIDVTRKEEEKRLLARTLKSERIVLDCIKTMHSSADMDVAIQNTLCAMGEHMEGERIYIFEFDGDVMSNTYEWCRPGITAEKQNLVNLQITDIHRWMEYFTRGDTVMIEDLDELRIHDTVEYAKLKPQNIQSLIAVPILEDGQVIGFFGIDNPPKQNMNNISDMLKILSYFFQSLLQRKKMDKKLRQMSYADSLTGAMNRNAFIRDLTGQENIAQEKYGVVFVDVNGLKETNDSKGHTAGDCVLIEIAHKIQSAFAGYREYRTGGDEFVILCKGIEEEAFRKRIERLRINMGGIDHGSAAIGAKWVAQMENLQELISVAEEKMYQDKKRYYGVRTVRHFSAGD